MAAALWSKDWRGLKRPTELRVYLQWFPRKASICRIVSRTTHVPRHWPYADMRHLLHGPAAPPPRLKSRASFPTYSPDASGNTSATLFKLNFLAVRTNRIMKLFGSNMFGSDIRRWCFTHHEDQALHHKRAALWQHLRGKQPPKQTKNPQFMTFQIWNNSAASVISRSATAGGHLIFT